MASFFDIRFALERKPHPGEKRLLTYLSAPWESLVRALIESSPEDLPNCVQALMDRLDARLAEEGLLAPAGRIEHAAAWVSDLERACAFYRRWFGATAGPVYSSAKRPFESCFLSLGNGARLELMNAPAESPRIAHIAISLGSSQAVDGLIAEMRNAGVTVTGGPRITGDGYYEACVIDTEGNLVEITA